MSKQSIDTKVERWAAEIQSLGDDIRMLTRFRTDWEYPEREIKRIRTLCKMIENKREAIEAEGAARRRKACQKPHHECTRTWFKLRVSNAGDEWEEIVRPKFTRHGFVHYVQKYDDLPNCSHFCGTAYFDDNTTKVPRDALPRMQS